MNDPFTGGASIYQQQDELIRLQAAELARLRAENEQLKADAARMDSGRIAIDAEPGLFANPLTCQVIFEGDLRKCIDEAIEQSTPEWRAMYCVP